MFDYERGSRERYGTLCFVDEAQRKNWIEPGLDDKLMDSAQDTRCVNVNSESMINSTGASLDIICHQQTMASLMC